MRTRRGFVFLFVAVVLAMCSPTLAQADTNGCPCSLFSVSDHPSSADPDPSSVNVGTVFKSTVEETVTAVRAWLDSSNTATTVDLWKESDGTLLGSGTFAAHSGDGWVVGALTAPVAITAGTRYIVSYLAPAGHYSATSHVFDTTLTNGVLVAEGNDVPVANGRYTYSAVSAVPATATSDHAFFWVDVVLENPAAPTATPASTSTPVPTATPSPAPSVTPGPTATPAPMPTPTPSATPTDSVGNYSWFYGAVIALLMPAVIVVTAWSYFAQIVNGS